ncbi:MAG: hypothetical protein ACI8R4_000537 [Paracoccaceae bacterium]|jgi:hypothetical protein
MNTPNDNLLYVCLSDMHSGALSSVLTPLDAQFRYDPDATSATAATFGAAIGATLKTLVGEQVPPDLLLLGDALDMSFSSPSQSSEVLTAFLGEIYETEGILSNRIVFLPGNHDHALWTAERFDGRAESGPIAGFRHVTPAFQPTTDCPKSGILEQLVAPFGRDIVVPTYYPNMGLLNPAGDRAVVLHHGHFAEATYRMMNSLIAIMSGKSDVGEDVESLERYNGNWIDFGWSSIGADGALGKDVTIAYHSLLTGAEATKFQQRIAAHLAKAIAMKFDLPPTKMIEEGLSIVALGIIESAVGAYSQLERYSYTDHLSHGTIETLKSYLSKAVLPQMQEEISGPMPDRTTFVFGHTHKPFEDQIVVDGFDAPLGLYNTGGWVLDTALLSTVEGASAVFIDADLNTAAIRLFGMPVDGQPTQVRAVSADIDRPENPLLTRLQAAIDAHAPLWETFSTAVADDLMNRQAMILKMSADADAAARDNGGVL